MVITKDMLIDAIKEGVSLDDICVLFNEALDTIVIERQNDPKRKALMDGMMAYMGRDHELWNEMDPWDALEVLEDVLAEMVVCNCPLANCTEQECNCAADCSCDEKIEAKSPKVIGKIKSYDEKGNPLVRDITADEASEVLAGFLGSLGLR